MAHSFGGFAPNWNLAVVKISLWLISNQILIFSFELKLNKCKTETTYKEALDHDLLS